MSQNKLIINLCPNYYKIINFNPIIGDEITSKLIEMYRNFIFSVDTTIPENIKKVTELDGALNKYIDDYIFRKEVQKRYLSLTSITSFIDSILSLFNNYEEYTTRVIYISRWI